MTEHHMKEIGSAAAVACATLVVGLCALWAPGWVVAVVSAAAAGMSVWVLVTRDTRRRQMVLASIGGRLTDLASKHGAIGEATEPAVATLGGLERRAAAVSEAIGVAMVRLGDQLHGLEDVIEALDVPLMAVSVDGHVRLANAAACALVGRESEAVKGANLEDLFTEAAVLELMRQAREGRHAAGQVRINRNLMVRVLDTQASPVRLGGGRGVVLSFQDVTDLAMAVQLKTDFVGNASHELRTPIASIRAAVDTLLGPAKNDPQMHTRFAEMIRANVVRLEELVRDLLDLSRFESEESVASCAEVDCLELCADLAQVFEQEHKDRSIELEFQLHQALRRVWTDRSALELVLRNLIENAIKFSHDGGSVRVLGSVVAGEGGLRPGVRLDVIDQGIGIPVSHQQRIFERFFQVDQARSGGAQRRGTGLGLAIVKHAVRRLGGTVEVKSVWKQGTTMTVLLPDSVMGGGVEAEPPRRREVG